MTSEDKQCLRLGDSTFHYENERFTLTPIGEENSVFIMQKHGDYVEFGGEFANSIMSKDDALTMLSMLSGHVQNSNEG